MRVLLIGGNGFIGSRVAHLLAHDTERFTLRCMLRESSKTDRIDGIEFEKVIGDVRDVESLKAAMQDCGAVIHLASPSSWDDIDSPLMEAVVVEGTQNVLDAAATFDGMRVIYVSSVVAINGSDAPQTFDESSEYTLPDAKLRYARCKRRAEEICDEAAANGLHVVTVNPAEVYGPEDTALITAGNLIDFLQSSPVMVCDGGTSVVHVDDVAAGVVNAIEKGRPGERYILGGDNLSVEDLAKTTLEVAGRKAKVMKLPNGLIKAVAAVGKTLHLPLPFNPHVIPYATRYWFVDNSKAKEELGIEFRPAPEVLAPTIEWLRETGRVKT